MWRFYKYKFSIEKKKNSTYSEKILLEAVVSYTEKTIKVIISDFTLWLLFLQGEKEASSAVAKHMKIARGVSYVRFILQKPLCPS